MAQQDPNSVGTRRFDKGLNEDVNDYHLAENEWTHARNATLNSTTGDLGKLGNEPSNAACAIDAATKRSLIPYTIIGALHIIADKWLMFSTDDSSSEIGIFQEFKCTYDKLVNDDCLGFNKKYPIKGVTRATSTCTFKAYFDDGNRVSRMLEFDPTNISVNEYFNPNSTIPWKKICVDDNGSATEGGCVICTNTPALDCSLLRLARYITTPCAIITKGVTGGTLINGSYMVAIAYAIDGVKVSDWQVSNVQPLFHHNDNSSSLDISLLNLDKSFQEIQIAFIYVVKQQTVARLAGTYSTNQQNLSFDTIDNTWPVISIEELPIMTPIVDKSDAMYSVGDYLIRVGTTSKEDFNYQPLANRIVAKYQSVEYPLDFYRKGGNIAAFMRDEVYPFFIRWVFDTGDKSAAYHIPGRPSFPGERALVSTDALQSEIDGGFNYKWLIENTAFATTSLSAPTLEGGVIIEEGYMAYWESSEYYPADKPQVWNGYTNPITGFNATSSEYTTLQSASLAELDLCGKPIRHHRFPDLSTSSKTRYSNDDGTKIRLMGIVFDNIVPPLMNDGITPVPGIVGYEILRGSRNGNKTILAKGLINNMREYDTPDGSASANITSLYPNYPYNDLREDPFLTTEQVPGGSCTVQNTIVADGITGLRKYSKEYFTFHSPDTNFSDPFLSAKEVKIHGEFNGDVTGKFEISEEHPKEKLITNFAFILASVAGIGIALAQGTGKTRTKYLEPRSPGFSEVITGVAGIAPNPTDLVAIPLQMAALNTAYIAYRTALSTGTVLAENILAGTKPDGGPTYATLQGAYIASVIPPALGMSTFAREYEFEDGENSQIPGVLRAFTALPLFLNHYTRGTDELLNFFKAVGTWRNFATRYHSHCFYNRYLAPSAGNIRWELDDSQYIGPQLVNFNNTHRINNVYRAKTVALKVVPKNGVGITDPTITDITRIKITNVLDLTEYEFVTASGSGTGSSDVVKDPSKTAFSSYSNYQGFELIVPGLVNQANLANNGYSLSGHTGIQVASSHYVSLKQRIRNQYGQINGVNMVPASRCVSSGTRSSTIFGGDTYLGRYTEKNTFFYFYDWLYGQPDGAQLDYKKYIMIPYPRFFANFEQFETNDFINSLSSLFQISNYTSASSVYDLFNDVVLPSDFYNLDGLQCGPSNSIFTFSSFRLLVKNSYFYLFNSGVKDFLVESEINIDLRDWGTEEMERHYDPYNYTDTKSLFNTKIIKSNNYYKYDQSLSVARLFINYSSWAATQPSNYDPYLAETCFIYNPNRIIYSLPSQFENIHDTWTNFLANNYYNFTTRVTCIKPVNKNGALIFFEGDSPAQFFGTDQLQTTGGTKLTIGDGGLFSQPLQNLINADKPYEYASCQDRLSVVNTPFGVFWISQNQGKIFSYQSGLAEVSSQDLKWWLINYLPYALLVEFPDFELTENTIIGIGCQSIYDNQSGVIYFSKRDFAVKKDLPIGVGVRYVSADDFMLTIEGNDQFLIKLGDARYFEDASWTMSFNPQTKNWISYHDWHPNLMMPGKNTFMTVKDNGIWVHNTRTDSFCNFYGKDYPFEVEYLVDTVQQVDTLRSIQYQLECYKYAPNQFDRFHVLDYNFDQAVIYNTEQVSGLLNLILSPKNDPFSLIMYPKINFDSIDSLYSKEENRYRFNQFWDITDDRGEYNRDAQRMIWNTSSNGYNRILNANNMNYQKDAFQRKKFRHYMNYVFLRKKVSGDRKMLVIFTNNKEQNSPR